ncbi:MAG: hypothetical protein K6G63_03735 [Eubacterium sp.]|nr:hypothetical protein [Eubacterium sp.]
MKSVLRKLAKYDSFIKSTDLAKTTKIYSTDIKEALKVGDSDRAVTAGKRAADMVNKRLGNRLIKDVVPEGKTIVFVLENGDRIKR